MNKMGLGMRLLLFECRSAPRTQLSSNVYGLSSFNAPSTMSLRILTNIENIYNLTEARIRSLPSMIKPQTAGLRL